jgi:hypothetical protein
VVGGSSSASPAGVAAVRHGVLVRLPAIWQRGDGQSSGSSQMRWRRLELRLLSGMVGWGGSPPSLLSSGVGDGLPAAVAASTHRCPEVSDLAVVGSVRFGLLAPAGGEVGGSAWW